MSDAAAALETVIIDRRYRGPSESANGGYACGVVARRLGGAAVVRLQRPPPLERDLTIRRSEEGRILLLDDDATIAAGAPGEPEHNVARFVSIDEATDATSRYRWMQGHPFPQCFVCGPERTAGDGLRIFPGAAGDGRAVASPWTPDESVCDDDGRAPLEVLWAALDCPSWFGILEAAPDTGLALLGEMTAAVRERPRVGEPCVVVGWSRGRSGRKRFGGAALYRADGTLLGRSNATWIEVRTPEQRPPRSSPS